MSAKDVIWKWDPDGSLVVKFPSELLGDPEQWTKFRTDLFVAIFERDVAT